jgi:menaquinone-dependent protoporphyrinogen IX oxidase
VKFRGLVCLIAVMICLLSLLKCMEARNDDKNIVIIYASRYGSTAQTAKWVAEGMEGKPKVTAAKEAGDLASYGVVVLGSGIYGGQLHKDMQAFLDEKKGELKNKIVALFVVCGSPPDYAQGYLDMFDEKCGVQPILMRSFGGWIKKELLSPEDYKILEGYYKSINQPFEDSDDTDKPKCVQFGKEIFKVISNLH